ncbi:type III pantothenate kinase [Candidatus Thiodictyon syntrophicum]|jgi:type III pantothenate kinase|uniref:Type III pantothenate kinase n=1 Tax=Candidatus Thiodictyon syntrophicum TaxID=1166950 RepID=A0A2K8U5H0_9GAMM|nr:type III pantothenate kinase [Candidatus Thiodictyon syntrophicum]AUB80832.1 type III pantothenate kinase [Candidatus Thiodictyon syntrophicum]
MNLLIDIGNTNLHWARQDAAGLGPMTGVRHGGGLPLDLLAAWEALDPPRRVLVGNVGGADLGETVARVVRAYWGLEAQFAVTRRDCLGLRVAYAQPTRLGVDRWLALLGALGRGAAAALVVDVGTAATFDVLASAGQHLGGLILPGLTMMRDSLFAGTRIPPGEPEPTDEPWAADTGAAVATGSLHALAALAERLHQRLWDRLSESAGAGSAPPPALLITGGDGPRIAPLIARPLELVPELVLCGLARLASTQWRPEN